MKMRTMCLILALGLMLPLLACTAPRRSSLEAIAAQIDEGDSDEVEPLLLEIAQRDHDAAAMTLLARVEYLRAVAGLAEYPGMPPRGWDETHMAAAERWVQQALTADPKHANAWVVAGQIRYASGAWDESLAMLERAEALDPSSIKLRLRKGDTLRAMGFSTENADKLDAAAREYERVMRGPVDDGNERLAMSRLAEIHAKQRKPELAIRDLDACLKTATGAERAFTLEKRSTQLILLGRADEAIEDAGQAIAMYDFGIGRRTLATALMLKAGLVARGGDHAAAAKYITQMHALDFDIAEEAQYMVLSPATFPALYALLEPGLESPEASDALANVIGDAAGYVTAADVAYFHAHGVRFDASDERFGTVLHRAVTSRNLGAVRALLEAGADPSARLPNSMSLLDIASFGTTPASVEIRRLIAARVPVPAGWTDGGVDLPVDGLWYQVTADIANDGPNGVPFKSGEVLLSGGACFETRVPNACMVFYTAPNQGFRTLSLPMKRIGELKRLRATVAPLSPSPP